MTRDPACCTPEVGLREVAWLMVEHDCGAIPIVESGTSRRPVGIITDRDIACRAVALGRNPLELVAGDLMTTPVFTLTTQASLEECCRLMEWRQVRRVPIVDEHGACCGIVAQGDVARKAPEHETAELVQDVSMRAIKMRT